VNHISDPRGQGGDEVSEDGEGRRSAQYLDFNIASTGPGYAASTGYPALESEIFKTSHPDGKRPPRGRKSTRTICRHRLAADGVGDLPEGRIRPMSELATICSEDK
jgi:hypothetical protein